MTTSLRNVLKVLSVTVAVATGFMAALPARAGEATAEDLVQANNPLASFKTFNIHNYSVPTLTDMPDETANTLWLRYAQPVGRFLVRASLPTPTVPGAGQEDATSGIGDFNAFAAYLAVSTPALTLGVGPIVTAPTASEDVLGSGKWQGGVAAVVFGVPMPEFQYGGLITWQASFAGDSDRADTSVLALQPFGIWQLGAGTYVRSTGVWVFDLEKDTYNVPVGLGIGKVLKVNGIVFNIFAEPQFTVLHKGVGLPEVQLFIGLNTQFTAK